MNELNHLAAEMLFWDEGDWTLLGFALAIAGGVIGHLTMNVETHLRRVAYLWVVIATQVIVIIVGMLSFPYVGVAAEAGALWAAVFVMPAACVGAGVLNYWGAAARSNDIQNSPSKAWLGFVPLANLYLIFKGRDPHLVPPHAERHWAKNALMDPVLVLLAFAVFGLVNSASELEGNLGADASQSAELTEMLNDALTIEEIVQAEADASQAVLPQRIDEITTLARIEAEGKVLLLVYEIDEMLSGFNAGFSDSLAQDWCRPEVFGNLIQRGAVIVARYLNPDDTEISTLVIDRPRCQ